MPKKIKKKESFRLSENSERKMSEIILEFAEPVLRVANDEQTNKNALTIAITCWDVALLPENEHEEIIGKIVKEAMPTEQFWKDMENIVRMLIERKKSLYPHVKKIIVDHDIQFSNGNIILNIASTPL